MALNMEYQFGSLQAGHEALGRKVEGLEDWMVSIDSKLDQLIMKSAEGEGEKKRAEAIMKGLIAVATAIGAASALIAGIFHFIVGVRN